MRYFPEEDIVDMFDVSIEYLLNKKEIALLMAIRKAENGGPGIEFGIMNKKVNLRSYLLSIE